MTDTDLIERLRTSVQVTGLHDDNETELFDVESANELMCEAADALAAKDAENISLREDVARLEMAVMLLPSNEDYATQAATIAKLRDALGFYARENNWRSMSKYMCGHSGETTATIDGGKRARQALEETGQ